MTDLESITSLHQQLDTLWIRYLDLLEQYTQAQDTIRKALGQGFLSLAQANFTSSGRRYGQDYYDERAVASSRVQVSDDSGDSLSVEIVTVMQEVMKSPSASLPTPEPEDGAHDPDWKTEPTQLPTPEPENSHERVERKSEEEHPRLPTDPLRQFGILIPSALRSAQKSFSKAVQDGGALVKAINSAREMREVEVEIRKARKVLKRAERDAGGIAEK
ncbi:uncharacterized protein RCC_01162 [Ramularia collo-cygni]|uniref:Vacuolar ATPase assembly protein VMA22 n=1 Tax=Ramularia collo-cygni TaxID=112498 RepID=A0A2D3UNV8_9PEZI|nr:uncharacterized protein RCC_01162 [Ramularia collo-cygni]CZT15298.1 uncharacterized protein RCC_01162 [Ramularia collo-cygni]